MSTLVTSLLRGSGWLTPRPGHFTPGERQPVPIIQEAGWAPEPACKDAVNLASTGIRSPESPARSESVYLLRSTVPPAQAVVGNNRSVIQGLNVGRAVVY
jgi:hypothetical protein